MEKVVNIHKKKGIRPHYDVYIGRITRNTEFKKNSKWYNPWLSLEEYEIYIRKCIKQDPDYFNLDELDNKVLGCWCKPAPCHGDILIKLLKEKRCKS